MVVLQVLLVSHLLMTFGIPLPVPRSTKSTAGVPYPCQSRPCGCLTSEQCWAGDCCCFTLDEKVAWADRNGVSPPEHVWSLLKDRKPAAPKAEKKSCCSEETSDTPICCQTATINTTTVGKTCCEKKSTSEKPRIQWVSGVFAKKCRGFGPDGLQLADLIVVPDLAVWNMPIAVPVHFSHPTSVEGLSTIHDLAVPPPRHI